MKVSFKVLLVTIQSSPSTEFFKLYLLPCHYVINGYIVFMPLYYCTTAVLKSDMSLRVCINCMN